MKQKLLLLAACILIAVITTCLYRHLQSGWVAFRAAESDFSRQRYSQAADNYSTAMAAGLAVPELFRHMAAAQLGSGNTEGAAQTASYFLKSDAATSKTMFEFGEVFVGFGRFEEAIRLLEQAVLRDIRTTGARDSALHKH